MRGIPDRPRIACAAFPAWPLQILLREHPSWSGSPLVVVAADRANAEVLLADARAKALGITVGMRHGTARSLAPELRSGVVTDELTTRATTELLARLTERSPRVEPVEPGVFFLDPSGLEGLYGSLAAWADAVYGDLAESGYRATVLVGFGRYRTKALASRMKREGALVLPDPATEESAAKKLPLAAFDASPELVRDLAKLGIRRVSELLRLPPLELAMRFGPDALALHARASDSSAIPLTPATLGEPVQETIEVEPPDSDVERLLFAMKSALDRIARVLRQRSEAVARLALTLTLDRGTKHEETLEPAAPTLETPLLVELLRLRLSRVVLPSPVVFVLLVAEGVRVDARQLSLLEAKPMRDVEAAARAFARLRAAFGPECVARIELRDAHLPEARFAYANATSIRLPHDVETSEETPLVRRLLARPRALEGERPLDALAIERIHGPYRIEGGWWAREVSRDYYYAETARGTVLFLYRDARRAKWFLHGEVD